MLDLTHSEADRIISVQSSRMMYGCHDQNKARPSRGMTNPSIRSSKNLQRSELTTHGTALRPDRVGQSERPPWFSKAAAWDRCHANITNPKRLAVGRGLHYDSFGEPPPPDHVPLPWNNHSRRVPTRLAQRSAAVVNWLDTLYPDEILEVKGVVPTAVMAEIQRRLQHDAEANA